MTLYILVNTVLGAYIVGSITLLIVGADARTGQFRERMQGVISYGDMNGLSAELLGSMERHTQAGAGRMPAFS